MTPLLLLTSALLLAYVGAQLFKPDYAETLAPDSISAESGHAFIVRLPPPPLLYRLPEDAADTHRPSKLIVEENGNRLEPGQSEHSEIRTTGQGAYSHWHGYLYFSSSDNTDPRENGRVYVARGPLSVSGALSGLLLPSLAATVLAFVLLWSGGSRHPVLIAVRLALAHPFTRRLSATLWTDRSAALRGTTWLALNILALLALAGFVLTVNTASLMNGLDGNYVRGIAELQLRWWDVGLSLKRDLIRGDGSLSFPLNAWLILPYAVPSAWGEVMDVRTVFTVLALEVFLATYASARLLRFGPGVAALAAWVLTVAALPFFSPGVLYPIIALVPRFGEKMAVGALICALTTRVADMRPAALVAATAAMTAGFCQLILSGPVGAVLFAPAICAYGLAGLWFAARDPRSRRRFLASAGVVAVAVLGVCAPFAVGIGAFSAPTFFSADFVRLAPSGDALSSVFNRLPAAILVCAGVLGAATRSLTAVGQARGLALLHLLLTAGVFLLGLHIAGRAGWLGPAPIYFEIALWPFHAIYAGFLVRRLFSLVPGGSLTARVSMGLCVAAVIVVTAHGASDRKPYADAWRTPFSGNPITARLEADLAVRPGDAFRGRAASFVGMSLPPGASWPDMHAIDYRLINALGDDLRLVGPAYDRVPVLQEYSQSVSALSHLVKTRLLSRPADRQVRNVILLTRPDARFLAANGVRYVLSEDPVPGTRERLRLEIGVDGIRTVRLSEIADPNFGNYSPTEVVVVGDLAEAIARLKDGIDARRQVILFEEVAEELVPARDAELVLGRNGDLVFGATSSKTSLVVLPFQFSHCQRIGAETGRARLVQANAGQTGILFSGTFRGVIRFRFGPFENPLCRMRDARAFRRLGAGDAARRFPVSGGRLTR